MKTDSLMACCTAMVPGILLGMACGTTSAEGGQKRLGMPGKNAPSKREKKKHPWVFRFLFETVLEFGMIFTKNVSVVAGASVYST